MTEQDLHRELSPTPERVVPMELVDAYRDYIQVVSPEKQNLKIPFNIGVRTRLQVVDHLYADDEIGRSAARAFLETTQGEMKESGIEDPTKEEVLARVIMGFKRATYKILVEG